MDYSTILRFLLSTVEILVDSPNDIQIRKEETEEKVLYIISPKAEEVGQLVGEKGCIANSLRTILRSISQKYGLKKLYLVVVEPKEFIEKV